MSPPLHTWLPFLRWFPMSGATLRADLVAGITVALVLVPQSMAYALLAGLPVVYGLYAALLPVVIGALFGNFNLLHTGPVVMLSLMSAAAIAPFAITGSDDFIALSILLALMVGVLRLLMGAFKLGGIVNLVSHPVLVGFTNAAALIIGLSQLRFIMNMPNPGTGSFAGDVAALLERADQAYLPAIAFAVGAGLLMWLLARWLPKVPAVLLAVVFGTAVSAAIGYERVSIASMERIADPEVRGMIAAFAGANNEVKHLSAEATGRRAALREAEAADATATALAALRAEIQVLEVRVDYLKKENNARRLEIHAQPLVAVAGADGMRFYRADRLPAGAAPLEGKWRFQNLKDGKATLAAGGDVVGRIPEGLPAFQVPTLDWNIMLALLPAAFVMALIGFMEATAVSRALAAKSHARIDANKELVGQGLANIVGAFFQSYAVSGSFSRSAVAARAGAKTGLYAVVSALIVVVVLLFLTPHLYHLPQAVLATIVMMAVFGLIRVTPLIHAWKVQRSDAVAGLVTFAATLAFAPDIANGILVGMALTAALFLLRTMKPRATVVGRKSNGSVGGMDGAELEPLGRNFVAMRFDRSLNYLNVAAFEDTVLEVLAHFPQTRGLLVIASGINELDASGEDKVRELALRLRQQGVTLMFSSLKTPVAQAFARTGLLDLLQPENVFPGKEVAIAAARRRYDLAAD
ncbi:MAG: sodium-independent anion transporter [Hydrogenophilales bacterium 17-64-11]|nr:MAG: sodium-independent anion transporter [Hydrogenophilales bacterium 17-64-11]